MKIFCLTSVVLPALIAGLDFDDASRANHTARFGAWKLAMGKVYESEQAEHKSFAGWLGNDKIIQSFNGQKLSFKLGHNEYSDMVTITHAHPNLHSGNQQEWTIRKPLISTLTRF